MRPFMIIILVVSSIALAYPDTSKFQALFERYSVQSSAHDNTDGLLYSRMPDEVDGALLWRRSGQPPPRPGKTSGLLSQAAFSGSAPKTSPKPTVPSTLKQRISQSRPSRLSTSISFARPSKGLDHPSSSAKSLQAHSGPRFPKSASQGTSKHRDRTQSRLAATEKSDHSGDQEMDPMMQRPHAEMLKYRAFLRANHEKTVQYAKGVIDEVNQRSVSRVKRGKAEPDRSAEQYQALKNAKMEVRRAHRHANQKIAAAGQALRQGPAMGSAAQEKFDVAHEAVRKADELSGSFQVDHILASASALQEGRWSDFSDHVKKEVKSGPRIDTNKAYLSAAKAQQRYNHDLEGLSKMDQDDPRRGKAVNRAVNSKVESIAAKQMYSFHHGLYRDARRNFPDDSSSEDEMDTLI